MSALCESRTSNKNTFQKSLELHRIKHLCRQSFTCWLILKDQPCRSLNVKNNTCEESKNMCHKSASLVYYTQVKQICLMFTRAHLQQT